MVQSLDLEFSPGFEDELAEGQPLPNVGKFRERKGAKLKTLSHEERERQAKVMKIGPNEWQKLLSGWLVSKSMPVFQYKSAAQFWGMQPLGGREFHHQGKRKILSNISTPGTSFTGTS